MCLLLGDVCCLSVLLFDGCALLVNCCLPCVASLCVARGSLLVVGCRILVVVWRCCCWLIVAERCSLFVAGCLLAVDRCGCVLSLLCVVCGL